MILAQYSIRSKQNYIFKTNRKKEAEGASLIIGNIFNKMCEWLKDKILIQRFDNNSDKFEIKKIKESFDNKSVQLVTLFCGGGNFTVLIDNEEHFKIVNQIFTYNIIKHYPGLIPNGVGVFVDGDDYKDDYKKLMAESTKNKNSMFNGNIKDCVPFAKVDKSTFEPYSKIINNNNLTLQLSLESYTKRKEVENIGNVEVFDNLVTMHDEESLLAVVHIDGNNMGTKVINYCGDKTDYDGSVDAYRRLTKRIDEVFCKKGRDAIDKKFGEIKDKYKSNDVLKNVSFKPCYLITNGDDFTFICNARFAYQLTIAYLKAINEEKDEKGNRFSSCAGICIFHSHYPFSVAYNMAEQCCDSAKNFVHKKSNDKNHVEQCWIDWHYIHGGVDGDVETIRKAHGLDKKMARPYYVCGDIDSEHECEVFGHRTKDDLERINEILTKTSRTNVKNLCQTIEDDTGMYISTKAELERIKYHSNITDDESKKLKENIEAIYDLGEIYDLWFREIGEL